MSDPSSGAVSNAISDEEDVSVELRLFRGVLTHDIDKILRSLQDGADINYVHPQTGLSALHMAVGRNDLSLSSFLVEECGAKFFPDNFGRWPTLIAAECQVDDELSDYIVEQEARYLEQYQS